MSELLLTADQVHEWFCYWRSWIHGQLVDSLELASSPKKEIAAFATHDAELHALAHEAAMWCARIELLAVFEEVL